MDAKIPRSLLSNQNISFFSIVRTENHLRIMFWRALRKGAIYGTEPMRR